jgi:hypothetical protein
MSWRVQWADILVMPAGKARGSLYSVAKRGSQVVSMCPRAASRHAVSCGWHTHISCVPPPQRPLCFTSTLQFDAV